MPSFVPCLNEEADTRIFLVLRKQLKGLSCAVDTDVVVLVIPVVQQL